MCLSLGADKEEPLGRLAPFAASGVDSPRGESGGGSFKKKIPLAEVPGPR